MLGLRGIYERLSGRSSPSRFRRAEKDGQELAHFTLCIGNYRHIRRAYGEDAALESLDELVNRINLVLQGEGVATAAAYGQIMVRMTGRGLMRPDEVSQTCKTWLWAFCAAISSVPVQVGPSAIFTLLSANWDRLPEGDAFARPEPANPWYMDDHVLVSEADSEASEIWARRYREDMALAAEVLAAITPTEMPPERGETRFLLLLWQAVYDAGRPGQILYHEALLRFVDRHGGWIAPSQSLFALERLGLVRMLDEHIVSRVIARLEANPDARLAVNISARSARADPWWAEIMTQLRAKPEVAHRLTIEITETAALLDVASAVRFVQAVKRLGCKVALDDFGAGFTSIRQIMALSPDIVKIDGYFIREADISARGREIFLHLVQLARSFGTTVVVEGVETRGQSDLAQLAGGHWQQGYYWARPSVSLSNPSFARTPAPAAGAWGGHQERWTAWADRETEQ